MKKLMKLSLVVLLLGLALGIGGKAAGGRLYGVIHGRIQPVDWDAIRRELYDDWCLSPDGCRARDWHDPDDWFVPYDAEDCCDPDDWNERPDIPLYDS